MPDTNEIKLIYRPLNNEMEWNIMNVTQIDEDRELYTQNIFVI